jgi:hypothetical protein
LLTAARIFGRTKLVNQLTTAELLECCVAEIVSNGEPLQYYSHTLRGRRRAWRFFGNARRSHSGGRLGWNNGKA